MTNFYIPKGIDFITLWGNYDILYNLEDGATKESGDMFIPYDVTFGKMVSPKVVASLTFSGPIYQSDTYQHYDFQTMIRVGFFF